DTPTQFVETAQPLDRHKADLTPIDLDTLPALTPGTDLTRIFTDDLTMDELFALSQVDGRTSLRQLISITKMNEKALFRLMHHAGREGYAELGPRPVQGPPVRQIRTPSRVSATLTQPQEKVPPHSPASSPHSRMSSAPPRSPAASAPPRAPAQPEPQKPVVPEPRRTSSVIPEAGPAVRLEPPRAQREAQEPPPRGAAQPA